MLETCLKDTMKTTYEAALLQYNGVVPDDEETCGEVYQAIKTSLMTFQESPPEKTRRVNREWEDLCRHGRESAPAWLSRWRKALHQMTNSGIEPGARGLALSYSNKIGARMQSKINMD